MNINESVKVYSFYTDDTKTTLIKSYVRKYDSKDIEIAFGFGSQPDKDGHFTITYQDQSKEEAQIIDARGSYTVGDTVYTRYVDAEDLTLVYYETFLGTNLYYYTVKLDGYGHMYFLDEHDDGICNMYTGTYASIPIPALPLPITNTSLTVFCSMKTETRQIRLTGCGSLSIGLLSTLITKTSQTVLG